MANTTWQDLAGLNPQISNPNLIYPGQQILLPDFTTYTVRSGDTLSGIAANFNKQQAIIEVDPEDNLAEDPDLPDEAPLSDEEEENQDDKVEDDEDWFTKRHAVRKIFNSLVPYLKKRYNREAKAYYKRMVP